MQRLWRCLIAVLIIVASWVAATSLHSYLDPNTRKSDEEREDASWIASSKYALDRMACRWIGICGIAHWHPDPPSRRWTKTKLEGRDQQILDDNDNNYKSWVDDSKKVRPEDWEGDSRVLKDVPQFVLDHAPLIHLHSKEQFWPSDLSEHLYRTVPYENHTAIPTNSTHYSVHNLHKLNEGRRGKYLFMTSKDDVEDRPWWLGSAINKPVPYNDEDDDEEEEGFDADIKSKFVDKTADYANEPWFDPFGTSPKVAEPLSSSFRADPHSSKIKSFNKRRSSLSKERLPAMPNPGGYSPAPSILVVVDKGNGIMDAFWFYFYSYNLGTTVFNIRFGNHVGDWEHSLIRFHNGVPKAIFFSAHSGGLAYSYNAVGKGKGKGREGRPVLYSAMGSHAMYATPGKHPYVLPFGLLADVTDKGPLWDPARNYLAYHFTTPTTENQDARSIQDPSPPSSELGPISLFASTTDPVPNTPPETLQPASCNPAAPTSWWWFNGHWGDKFYELRDLRQWRFVGQYHYVNGPFGPRFKNLGRSRVCQSRGSCRILESIREGKGRSWVGRVRVQGRGWLSAV